MSRSKLFKHVSQHEMIRGWFNKAINVFFKTYIEFQDVNLHLEIKNVYNFAYG